MNEQIKRRWLKALRSGQYVQGRGALCRSYKDGDTFCCLGVLTELAIQDEVIEGWEQSHRRGVLGVRDDDGFLEVDALPEAVAKWAGIASVLPIVITDEREVGLAELNDGVKGAFPTQARDFAEIADLIEEHL